MRVATYGQFSRAGRHWKSSPIPAIADGRRLSCRLLRITSKATAGSKQAAMTYVTNGLAGRPKKLSTVDLRLTIFGRFSWYLNLSKYIVGLLLKRRTAIMRCIRRRFG